MDPVNKWLWTIIVFMSALIIVVGWKAGSGRYEMEVVYSSTLENHDVIYVLDTKNGNIKARPWSHDEFKGKTGSNAGKVLKKWKLIKSKTKRQWNHRTGKYEEY